MWGVRRAVAPTLTEIAASLRYQAKSASSKFSLLHQASRTSSIVFSNTLLNELNDLFDMIYLHAGECILPSGWL
jgi:hypothetical protein